MDTYLFANNDQGSYYDNDDDDDDDNINDNDNENNSDNDDVAIGERNHEDAIESAKDEMSFCYGNKFHLRHDMAQQDDKFCNEYEKAMEYFDITSRLELVNTRLEVLSDLNEILIDAAQSSHGTFLEWTVIILIVFEILIEIFRAYRDEK